jgi:hypothetical protein
MVRARTMIADPDRFRKAEAGLHRAVDTGNARTAQDWRKAFGAYAHLIGKRRADKATLRLARKAFQYAIGVLPPEKDRDVPF